MSYWLYDTTVFGIQSSSSFMQSFDGLEGEKKFLVMTIIAGCITGVLCTLIVFISSTITSIHKRRLEMDLKREMIDRGMTADEIVKVIEAAPPLEDGTQRWIASWGRRKA
jgi:hypothetical protein